MTFPKAALLACAVRVLVYLGRTRQLGVTYSKHAPNARRLYACRRKLAYDAFNYGLLYLPQRCSLSVLLAAANCKLVCCRTI